VGGRTQNHESKSAEQISAELCGTLRNSALRALLCCGLLRALLVLARSGSLAEIGVDGDAHALLACRGDPQLSDGVDSGEAARPPLSWRAKGCEDVERRATQKCRESAHRGWLQRVQSS